ncbi:SDR family oxidoreductase [Caldalkalibacillus salinus]|uniref:SDR family oxidoreductase n=1 Tax=Caldalkalibacillus salinus TaxID=2803787 RepID=UPI001921B8B0|nr:SDR family oxidoreductase [Caldalkalibacillus salinus]
MTKRVALITGSATGLGVQAVEALAKDGHHVAINYRNSEEQAKALLHKIQDVYEVKGMLVQGDVSQQEDCHRMVQKVVQRFGRIDILVLNAGPYVFERKRLVDYTSEEWDLLMSGNLSSFFYLTRYIIPLMREQKWGRIITFGFNHAGQASGWKYRSVFAAAKVGLVSLTKSTAEEESEHGITVNMICPGDIVGENKEKTIEGVQQQNESQEETPIAPIGRPGSGEDIARVVTFLSSEKSDFITGSVIEVNGGMNVLKKRSNAINKTTERE